jgi:hypothetical protein
VNFFQELEIGEAVYGDLAAFAAGAPVSASPTIANQKVSVTVVHLPNGAVPPYEVVAGGVFAEIFEAYALGEEYANGGKISVAMKISNSWYGITFSKAT